MTRFRWMQFVVALVLGISLGAAAAPHAADYRAPENVIDLSELLRVIQFFNIQAFHCGSGTEDGYATGSGAHECTPHSSDYAPQDWTISLSELLRLVQFFNTGGYHEQAGTEDGFAPGYPTPAPGEMRTFAGIQMVWIPAGTFWMGSARTPEETRTLYGGDAAWYAGEQPRHAVTISRGFWMGRYEITQAQWQTVMTSNPSAHLGADLPVESISWADCQAFIGAVNLLNQGVFRLPTEAEWEYACRAESESEYCFGDDMASLGGYAWFFGNSDYLTHPGGQKSPNAWGLYDMHGNVWECCQDWYGQTYYAASPAADPSGPVAGTNRVLRGGTCKRTEPKCRSAFRSWNAPTFSTADQGMRVCREEDLP